MKKIMFKNTFLSFLLVAGLAFASCGSNKTEGETDVDGTTMDTVTPADMDMEPTIDTVGVDTDTVVAP